MQPAQGTLVSLNTAAQLMVVGSKTSPLENFHSQLTSPLFTKLLGKAACCGGAQLPLAAWLLIGLIIIRLQLAC